MADKNFKIEIRVERGLFQNGVQRLCAYRQVNLPNCTLRSYLFAGSYTIYTVLATSS
jgi:hypothetical protein